MRQIKILFLFITNILIAQTQCPLNDVLEEFVLSTTKYKEQNLNVELEHILLDQRTQYLGYIGINKKKLSIYFESVEKSPDDEKCYTVKGKTSVFNGESRKFNGEINLTRNYVYEDLLDNDVVYSSDISLQGFSLLSYQFSEDKSLSSTGVFKGLVLVNWYKDKKGKYHYDETLGYNPSYSNCTFIGSWKSFKTGNKSKTGWAHYRILCSGDLDIGASEFSPNEKYYKYGWSDTNNENELKPVSNNSSFQKKWNGIYTFSLSDLTRMGETHSASFNFDITNYNNPKIIITLDKDPKKIKECKVTHVTNDTLVLMDLKKHSDIYILSKNQDGSYDIAGSPIYLLNPPNESYPLRKK